MNYYNEHDPNAAAWLRELIRAGHLPQGEVDERDIQRVAPGELRRFTQCHFFAGIGGWPLALRLVGWPEDRPAWTGSCPCQPFSVAGKGKGESDERHLWPAFRELIRACQPATVFGEQVASAAGRQWLAGVFADLEGMAYQRAGADLCAAGVGAPHIRQRLWWFAVKSGRLAHSGSQPAWRGILRSGEGPCTVAERSSNQLGGSGDPCGLADAEHAQRRPQHVDREHVFHGDDQGREETHGQPGACGEVRTAGLEHPEGDGREQRGAESGGRGAAGGCGACGLGDAYEQGCARQSLGLVGAGGQGYWSKYQLIPCLDGKARRIEPGTFPLAHGVSGRVGLLRGYGNAINPWVAAEFIQAATEATNE